PTAPAAPWTSRTCGRWTPPGGPMEGMVFVDPAGLEGAALRHWVDAPPATSAACRPSRPSCAPGSGYDTAASHHARVLDDNGRVAALPAPCRRRLQSLAGTNRLDGSGSVRPAARGAGGNLSQRQRRWGWVTAGTAEVVITTKLFRPSPRQLTVERKRLHDLLRQGNTLPLTMVVAPAGWGKSTLVADWLAHDRVTAGWVSLDGGDNDPKRFWRSLLLASEQAGSEASRRYRQKRLGSLSPPS